jgi:hypothetical protein
MKVRAPFEVHATRWHGRWDGRWSFCALQLHPPYVRNLGRHGYYFSMDLTRVLRFLHPGRRRKESA